MDILIRIVLAVFVVIGVYSILYGLIFVWKYKGQKSYAVWHIHYIAEERVPMEMFLRGLMASSEQSNAPVKEIVVYAEGLSVAERDVCKCFEERHPHLHIEENVSRET